MLSPDKCVLVLVDVQGKLAQIMHGKEALFRNLQILVHAMQALEVPILWCEQNPQGLGPTIPEVAALLKNQQPMAKMTFSCFGDEAFRQGLKASSRKQVLLAGIEAHVCIYLTAADLLAEGYQVEVVSDAVSSRSNENKTVGLNKIESIGGGITCTETALFELLQTAENPKFKQIIKLLK